MATDTERLLELLLDAEVTFVVVGGTAALAHGAVTPTQDLDIAAPLTEPNLERLMAALRPFHPKHATRPDLGEVWQTPAELSRFRLLLLETELGRLDVLGRVEPIGDFADLRSVDLELVEGRRVPVIELDQLLRIKAHLNRPKERSSRPSSGPSQNSWTTACDREARQHTSSRRFQKNLDGVCAVLDSVLTEATREFLAREQLRPAFVSAAHEVLEEHADLLERLAR